MRPPHTYRTARSFCLVARDVYIVVLAIYMLVPPGTPGTEATQSLPGTTLGAHYLAQALLFGLVAASGAFSGWTLRRQILTAAVVSSAVNLLLELLQGIVPWRTMSLRDAVLGLAGTFTAAVLWLGLACLLRYPQGRLLAADD